MCFRMGIQQLALLLLWDNLTMSLSYIAWIIARCIVNLTIYNKVPKALDKPGDLQLSNKCYLLSCCLVILRCFSCVKLFPMLWTIDHQASLHGILQARILKWVAMPFFRGSSWPRVQTHISYLLHWQVGSLPLTPPGKPLSSCYQSFPASRYFPMSQLFALSGQSIEASASTSVLAMNIKSVLYDWLVWSLCWPRESQESFPAPQFESIIPYPNFCTFFFFVFKLHISSVQSSSITQSCPTLCDPRNCGMPGLPVHQQFPEFTQTHVPRVGDAIQPSHPLSSPSSPAPNPSQHQGLFQWVNSLHMRWPKYWSFSFSISPSNEHTLYVALNFDFFFFFNTDRFLIHCFNAYRTKDFCSEHHRHSY